jgi:hypothetical protein
MVWYADGAILKEKLWTLIAQNEPSLISLQLVILLFWISTKNNLLSCKIDTRSGCTSASHTPFYLLFTTWWATTLWNLHLCKMCLEK